MSGTFNDTYRQVFPRWLDYKSASLLSLLHIAEVNKNILTVNPSYNESEVNWIKNQTIFSAVDLLGEALFIKKYSSEKALEAAKYILSYQNGSLIFLKEIANHYIEDEMSLNNVCTNKVNYFERKQVHRLRQLVHEYPLNPIAWSDLSLFHAILGNNKKSREAMLVAAKLGKGNRFILRSAARCFLHIGEPDISLEILKKSDLCGFDPWINSAEIAIADKIERKSYCISSAKNLLKDNNLSPFSKSELAACLGTIEFKNGSNKKGKLYFKEALMDPSENALAQIQWILSRANILNNPDLSKTIPASYEAQARYHFRNENYSESISAAEKWARFQQFSSMPIILASYITSVCLDDDDKNISLIKESLPIHQQNHTIMNNLTFSLIRTGRLDEAKQILNCISQSVSDDHENNVITATRGLYFYRLGENRAGLENYQKAIRGFERNNDYRSAAIASYYWAIEEKRIQSKNTAERITDAKKRIKNNNVFELIKKVNLVLGQ